MFSEEIKEHLRKVVKERLQEIDERYYKETTKQETEAKEPMTGRSPCHFPSNNEENK